MIAFLAACVLGLQDKPTSDPAAEQALHQLFASVSSLHNTHLFMTYYRAGVTDYFLPDHTNDLWMGSGPKFRMESTSLAGDYTSLLVCDGEAVMNDPMNDDDTITINRAGKPLYELVQREPIVYLLAGPDAYDKLVDKSQPIVFTTAPAGEKAIEVHSSGLGKVVFVYKDGTDNPIPVRIDMFRAFRRRDMGSESPTPTAREYVKVVSSGPMPSWLFSVNPPKGKKVEDDREKGS